ncbi:DNA-binding protein [Thioalkalivibrio thiocyanodenitrificans]|uniref:DNA-binding protein n=1 Tax=Thioalkalivibrio thiocyanodenitrificans TaxID=243063 RepID=UPI00037519D3|nr:DNA-binding protein [Thioalkalivibrio thiocyanodenitrificans]
MARNGIGYDDVKTAVESLFERGEDITIGAVRRELGDTGSLSTIQRHLNSWRSENRSEREMAQKVPETLENAFRRCLNDLWETSQQIAGSGIDEIRKATQLASEELQRDLTEMCETHDHLNAEVARLLAENDALGKERDHAIQKASTLAAEKAELANRFEDVVGRLEGRLCDLARVVEALSSAREATTPAAATKVRPATKRGRPKKANA